METLKPKSEKKEKGKIMLVIFFTFSISLVCSISLYSQSIAYKLATLEKNGYVSKDDLTVKRFDYLLTQLDNKYVDNKQALADKTVSMREVLKEKGVKESMIKMMEGMNTLNDPNDRVKDYSEYITIYVILRKDLPSHEETIKAMKESMNIIGIDGLMKAAGLK